MLLGLFELWNLKRQVDTVNNKILKRMVDIFAYSKVDSIDLDIFCQLTHATTDRCQTSEMKMSKLFAASANVWQAMQFLYKMEIWGLLSTHRYGRQGPKGIVWHGKGLEKLHLSTLNIIRFSWFSASGLTLVNEYSLHIVNSFNLKIVFILCCHCDCHINVMLQGSDISRVWSTVVAA